MDGLKVFFFVICKILFAFGGVYPCDIQFLSAIVKAETTVQKVVECSEIMPGTPVRTSGQETFHLVIKFFLVGEVISINNDFLDD